MHKTSKLWWSPTNLGHSIWSKALILSKRYEKANILTSSSPVVHKRYYKEDRRPDSKKMYDEGFEGLWKYYSFSEGGKGYS